MRTPRRLREPRAAELAAEILELSPYKFRPIDPNVYAKTLRAALARAGITDDVRPFQDSRHSSITNAARSGRGEHALMTLAGHSDLRTTRIYTHLAGEMFRPEADRIGAALWNEAVEKSGRNSEPESVSEVSADA